MTVSSPRDEAARRWSLDEPGDEVLDEQLTEARQLITNLERALRTSRTIGAAVGILMERHKVTQNEAFAILATSSQHSNRKLADLAEEIVYSGTLPAG